jgi:hypothetical protein
MEQLSALLLTLPEEKASGHKLRPYQEEALAGVLKSWCQFNRALGRADRLQQDHHFCQALPGSWSVNSKRS